MRWTVLIWRRILFLFVIYSLLSIAPGWRLVTDKPIACSGHSSNLSSNEIIDGRLFAIISVNESAAQDVGREKQEFFSYMEMACMCGENMSTALESAPDTSNSSELTAAQQVVACPTSSGVFLYLRF
jgi:hypothetical protein